MTAPLNLGTVALLTAAALLWAGNAIVGRLIYELISPFTLNFIRWAAACVLLLPIAWRVLKKDGPLWPHWKSYAVLGFLGIGCYNSLLYLSLKTSSPLNVTLVSASMPIWMLGLGRLFWGTAINGRQILGALLSICGVVLVLTRGDIEVLRHLQLVPGDLFMLLATLIWSLYTWLLTKAPGPQEFKSDWAQFLFAQVLFGVLWSGLFTATEASLGAFHLVLGWPLITALVFITIGPAILAYRFWGAGVRRSSPAVGGFFANLIPLFTAILSVLV
ncbi:MAG: DMT family transporter, partial [Burkholderiales bacterium]|nr:DMT family transporter [Burkholderiales bacterium]